MLRLAKILFSVNVLVHCCATFCQTNPLPKESLQTLASTYHVLREELDKPVTNDELIQATIRGLLKEVDPVHGELISKESSQWINYKGGSVGLEMSSRGGKVIVIAPIAGSPADKAGILPNDVLHSVNGEKVASNITVAVNLLRGPIDSEVTIAIDRPGETELRQFNLIRQVSDVGTSSLTMLTPEMALLRVPRFTEKTPSQLAHLLDAQWKRERFQGLILDLCRNTGGLLSSAVAVSSLFLPGGGTVVELRGKAPSSNFTYLADPKHYATQSDPFANLPPQLRSVPLVVIVDEGTASGAEIVAAALRDHKRARIVGRKTFGQTSIATVRSLAPNIAIKFTTAHWYPPSHEKLDSVGVSPDVVVQTKDKQLEIEAAVNELKKALQ